MDLQVVINKEERENIIKSLKQRLNYLDYTVGKVDTSLKIQMHKEIESIQLLIKKFKG